jgi:tRNA (uracil-5-)-methyltransferase
MHSFADLINVELPNPELRDMSRVQCKYFGTCAGCQYQVRLPPKVFDGVYDGPVDAVIRDAA